MEKLIIYTDGGARGNPGPAGLGIVFYNEKKERIKEISKFIGKATNNEAEYNSLILALKEAKKFETKIIEFYLDSELVVNQLNGKYRVKKENLKFLYKQAMNLINRYDQIHFYHISRDKNELADKLVNRAIDQKIL